MKNKIISVFNSASELEAMNDFTIKETLEWIKEGIYKKQIDKLRKVSKEEGKSIKANVPWIAFHGVFEGQRKKDDFSYSSGLIILDIDEVDGDIESHKKEIIENDVHVYAVMLSPSGNGIKILYHVDPNLVNADNYKSISETISEPLKKYGHVDNLSITDCMIMTYDPNIIVNEDAQPRLVMVKEVDYGDVELESIDKNKELWDDAEEFFETVLLQNIEDKSNNNYHFIQMSLFDLAKFGFKEPEYDLSFVVPYSESCHKVSSDNDQRYREASALASKYPQSRWPYKTTKNDDYIEDDVLEEGVKEESDGLIDYSNLFDRIKKVIKEGNRVGNEISLSNFADVFRFKGTGILTITGIPSHGKSEFVDQLILDLARLYGEETIVAGFEQSPEEHIIKLMRKLIGTNITCPSFYKSKANESIIKAAQSFITSKIRHVDIIKVGGDVDKILKVAKAFIEESRKAGGDPKYLVLDPFNMLSIKSKSNGHEKIEEILRKLTLFSHENEIMIILVAHPFKMKKDEKTGLFEVPDFYSVKGSSAFYEMSYHGLVVHRRSGISSTEVLVRVLKVKQNNLGRAGADVYFNYEIGSGRYIPIDEEGNELKGDHYDKDWLDKIGKAKSKAPEESKVGEFETREADF